MDFFPPSPLPGSNAIGSFIIGVSPIGTIEPFFWQDTIISQYANSPILMQLLENFNSYIDQTVNMDDFFDNIWNIDTAIGYGLDIWGRIVGVSRTLQVADVTYFGFNEADNDQAEPFNQGIFYNGQAVTSNYNLTDDAYRTLILAKALANICDGSTKAINSLLMNLFPNRGNCYVDNLGGMSIAYTFEFSLTPVELAIVTNSGVLPTPTGVSASIVINV